MVVFEARAEKASVCAGKEREKASALERSLLESEGRLTNSLSQVRGPTLMVLPCAPK